MDTKKHDICQALRTWINQRPGLEFGNYGDVKAYRQESRRITKQRDDALTMLALVERSSISGDDLELCFRAFSGRLVLDYDADSRRVDLDYCVGQYFPTEYRAAACSVLAQAIWDYYRDCGYQTGGEIRKAARDNLGRGIGSRWFN